MNIDQEIIENFQAHFKDAQVSIDLSDRSVVDGDVLDVRVVKKVEVPYPVYEIRFNFVPKIKETPVSIGR